MNRFISRLLNPIESTRLRSNFLFALLAQATAFSASAILAFIVPKVLGVEGFAYWQLFLLYSAYVGLASLGINDGLYLRIGGSKFTELNEATLGSQFLAFVAIQVIAFSALMVPFFFISTDENRLFVTLGTVVFGLGANLFSWIGYLLQATNLTHLFSFAVLVNKLLLVGLILTVIVTRGDSFEYFVAAYVFCQYISLAYVLICVRSIFRSWPGRLRTVLALIWVDLRSGLTLTIGYHAAILILGFSRFLVDAEFGLVEFGLFSFAISIAMFMLMFLSQVSLVLFPVFKRLDSGSLRTKYAQLREMLYLILPLVYLAFLPASSFLAWWLPDYTTSIFFLGLLLPMAVFDSKINMLGTTFMKILRKEKILLLINLASLALSVALVTLAVFVFRDLTAVCLAVVVTSAFRSLLFEWKLSGQLCQSGFLTIFFGEFFLATLFITAVLLHIPWVWAVFILAYCFYAIARKRRWPEALALVQER